MNDRVMKVNKESDVKYIKKVMAEKQKTAAQVKPATTESSATNPGAKVYGSPCLPQYTD